MRIKEGWDTSLHKYPEETPAFGYHMAVIKPHGMFKEWSVKELYFAEDPDYDDTIYGFDESEGEWEKPNPVPPKLGWYDYDSEYGYCKWDEVVGWVDMPEIED